MIAEEVDDEDEVNSSRKIAAAAEQVLRSTGPVDRTCTTCTGSESGRPVRSTNVHNVHRIRERSTDRSTAIP